MPPGLWMLFAVTVIVVLFAWAITKKKRRAR